MAKDAIFYSYTKNINGFAAYLDEEVATQMASKDILINHLFMKSFNVAVWEKKK
jgi:hypothetical protein